MLFAHLEMDRSRINRALRRAARGLERVRFHDLLETYPDFYIDVEHEQALLREADLVVIQHPLYWYGVPAIIKHWLDMVFTRGFAFGPDGGALRGKALMQVLSTGAPESAYRAGGQHGISVADLYVPLRALAGFCGMRWLEPLALHGGHGLAEEIIATHANRYRELLDGYVHGADPGAGSGED